MAAGIIRSRIQHAGVVFSLSDASSEGGQSSLGYLFGWLIGGGDPRAASTGVLSAADLNAI